MIWFWLMVVAVVVMAIVLAAQIRSSYARLRAYESSATGLESDDTRR